MSFEVKDLCDLNNDRCLFDLMLGENKDKRIRLFKNKEFYYVVEGEGLDYSKDYHLNVHPAEVWMMFTINGEFELRDHMFNPDIPSVKEWNDVYQKSFH